MSRSIGGDIEVFDSGELGKLLGVQPLTVLKAYHRGELCGQRVGKRILFSKESVRDYLNGETFQRSKVTRLRITEPKFEAI